MTTEELREQLWWALSEPFTDKEGNPVTLQKSSVTLQQEVDDVMRLVQAYTEKQVLEARVEEARDIRKNIEDIGTPVYFVLQRIDQHIATLSNQLK